LVSNIILTVYTWVQTAKASAIEALTPDDGQDIMEYAVLAGAVALVGGLVLFGGSAAGIDILGSMEDFGFAVEDCINMSGDCGF
jgi:hypothetical protein